MANHIYYRMANNIYSRGESDSVTTMAKRFPLKKFMTQVHIDEAALLNAEPRVEYILNDAFTGMIIQLKALLATGRETETIVRTIPGFVHHTCPATPWQHFKLAYCPLWFSKLFPVRMDKILIPYTKEVTTELIKVCPHLQHDPAQDHIEFLESKRGL